jgi:hypothetical protein
MGWIRASAKASSSSWSSWTTLPRAPTSTAAQPPSSQLLPARRYCPSPRAARSVVESGPHSHPGPWVELTVFLSAGFAQRYAQWTNLCTSPSCHTSTTAPQPPACARTSPTATSGASMRRRRRPPASSRAERAPRLSGRCSPPPPPVRPLSAAAVVAAGAQRRCLRPPPPTSYGSSCDDTASAPRAAARCGCCGRARVHSLPRARHTTARWCTGRGSSGWSPSIRNSSIRWVYASGPPTAVFGGMNTRTCSPTGTHIEAGVPGSRARHTCARCSRQMGCRAVFTPGGGGPRAHLPRAPILPY